MTSSPPPLPPADELVLVDRELARLEAHRGQLLLRRAWLISRISGPAAPRARAGGGGPVPYSVGPAGPTADVSGPGARNVLLALGGTLLAIAAIAFTVVSWGSLGIAGRGAVLAALTAAALGLPVVLGRRGLMATAEAVAGLGLVLTVLDAYALRQIGLGGGDPVVYTGSAAAVLAVAWAAYGRALPGLAVPLPAAVAAAQLPLVLWASAADGGLVAAALTATAAFDVAIAVRLAHPVVRPLAAGFAVATGGWAAADGIVASALADSPGAALGPGARLTVLAAVALYAARPGTRAAVPGAVAAGLVLTAALGGPVRAAVPAAWAVSAYTLIAAVLFVAVPARLPADVARGLRGAAAGVLGGALVLTLPLTVLALAGPVTTLPGLWRGAPDDAYAAVGTELPVAFFSAAPVTLLLVAGVLARYGRWTDARPGTERPETEGPAAGRPGTERPEHEPTEPSGAGETGRLVAPGVAAGLLWAALATVPAAVSMPYPAAVGYGLALALGALALGALVRSPVTGPVVPVCGLLGAAAVGGLASADRSATFVVLGAVVAALVAGAGTARAGAAVRTGYTVAAALFGCWLLLAGARAAELSGSWSGLLLMVVPAVLCAVAGRRSASRAVPLEATAALVTAVALLLASGDLPMISVLLGLAGSLAAATALRPERRLPAGGLAAALFLLATWVRLAAWEITVPEAYTLPVSVPALAFGVLLRRRTPATSSWAAYGPGLAATLLPSLHTAWGDPGWTRPLLLGLAALVITLAGAHRRLQAPLVLGAAVLALVALHELAPYAVQAMGVLPRWLPPALAGLLLLVTGATYEQRLRDARRLRDSVHRMR
ncbi:hypothetical protein AB0G74_34280 [Streptomyces sp. NPDC020875]|uniref:SCO7613 C-terminal domain-containing membrane protein n=1 Tax=Streptomyces sp. NPDC020875 TaxID=3154898 RepID=UPI0033D39D17